MIYANNATVEMFGCDSPEDLMRHIGSSFRGLVHPDDLDRVEKEISQQISNSPRNMDFVEYRIIRKDGQVRWVEDFGHLIHNEKWGDHFYVFISDISQRKLAEQSSAGSVFPEIDALTGLYTKTYFYKHVHENLLANPDIQYTIIASDIENFRFINETYGVDRGDEILSTIASRGRLELPGYVLGGRIDGDRFAYLFKTDEFSENELREFVRSTCREFSIHYLPIKYGLYEVKEDIPIQAMCNRALLALDSIKGVYGQQLAVYSNDLRMDWILRQQITASAEDSLRDGQFLVYYQPKHDLKNNCISGAEALVRWIHPDFGFMNPGLFIPLFEKNGFITKLDLFILEEVCRTLRRWQQSGRRLVPVSINLSRKDLDNPGMAEELIRIVDSFGLDHSLIHFEITETCFTENPAQTTACVRALHNVGFAIELDDFGSGYSSLVALNSVPIDILKIDLSIIRDDVPNSEHNILEFTMQLAKMMHMKTVQEGVETREQLLRVAGLGCDYVQGYFFSKPLPVAQFEDYLVSHNEVDCLPV